MCSVAQSCSALSNPMSCSPMGSSVHGILQAIILEWVAISPPGDLPDPGIEPGSPSLKTWDAPVETMDVLQHPASCRTALRSKE